MVLATSLFARRAQVAFRQTRARIAAVVGDLAEDISGMRVIQAFAQEGASFERFDRVNRANRDAYIDAMSLSFVFLPSVEFLGTLAMAIVLWMGGRSVANGALTLGVVVAFLAYVTRFFQPIQELSQLYTTMQAAMAGGERVLDLLDAQPEVRDAPDARAMPPIQGRIELRDVSFAYRGETEVLHNVNLVIEPGQTAALVGPTGAGKTSIANLVARFYDVNAGAVLIDGIDVRDYDVVSLRRQIGFVGQEALIFNATLYENIRYGCWHATKREIEKAITIAQLDKLIARLPKGLDTPLGERGFQLSDGEKQRLILARIILRDPAILILDEATSAIDQETERNIKQGYMAAFAERTIILISHRASSLDGVETVFTLKDGQVSRVDQPREMIDFPGEPWKHSPASA